MRSALALGAAAVAALAAVIAQLDGDDDIVPFFVALTVLALVSAWALTDPARHGGRLLARGIAVLWLGAATWIGGLLVIFQATCGCSMPGPLPPEATYLGLPATVYHLAGVYLGGALVAVAAFSRRL